MRRLVAYSLVACLVIGGLLSTRGNAAALPHTESGLLITPVRQFISDGAGSTKSGSLTVANLTSQPLTVNLSARQFSVSDYTYDYKFEALSNDWLQLGTASTTLQPNQSKEIPYSFVVPKGGTPGGHYYTIFASADLSSQGVHSTIQAAMPIYLTVSGPLTTVSHLQKSSISWLIFGRSVNFSLQPVNTGNTYSFVYVSGKLHGLLVRPPQTSAAHILIPGKVRALSGSIPAPILPGIYKAVYGYKTDTGSLVQQSHVVLYIPPWSVALPLAVLLIYGKLRSHRKPASGTDVSSDLK